MIPKPQRNIESYDFSGSSFAAAEDAIRSAKTPRNLKWVEFPFRNTRVSGAKRPKFSRIVETLGVCGGCARIRSTRIPVWGLARARANGCSDERILEMYPELSQEDLDEAWRYADSHFSEISRQIKANEEP